MAKKYHVSACLCVCVHLYKTKDFISSSCLGFGCWGVIWWMKDGVVIVTQSSGTLRSLFFLCTCVCLCSKSVVCVWEYLVFVFECCIYFSLLSAWWPQSRGETGAGEYSSQKTRATAGHTSKYSTHDASTSLRYVCPDRS